MNIEQIIQDLKAQQLDDNQIIEALKQMVTENKITEEDLQKAIQFLQAGAQQPDPEAEEKALASKLLNVDLN